MKPMQTTEAQMSNRELTQQEREALAALKLAQEYLDNAQRAVTAALVPVAELEASRHADSPRLAQCISEARVNVANAQRGVATLLEYGINPPPGLLGLSAAMNAYGGVVQQRARYTEEKVRDSSVSCGPIPFAR